MEHRWECIATYGAQGSLFECQRCKKKEPNGRGNPERLPEDRTPCAGAVATMEQCSNCRFWAGLEDDGAWIQRSCRRHAPVTTESHYRGRVETTWPETLAGAWCGDWQPKEKTDDVPAARMRALVEKMRSEAERGYVRGHFSKHAALIDCADELEALINTEQRG